LAPVQDVLLWFAVVMITFIVLVVTTALLVRRQLRRTNRVAHRTPTPAPVVWLWSPSTQARLHRRLQVAVAPIDPDGTGSGLPAAPETDALRRGLTDQAAGLDAWLAWSARARPRSVRRAHLRAAALQVAVTEDLAQRLAGRPGNGAGRRAEGELVGLAERIQALEEARAELSGPALPPGQADDLAQLQARLTGEAQRHPTS
jgi:hypothetical protein